MIITILITVRFDWKSEEKLLNSFPQFTTEISGLQVHFIRAAPKPKKGQVLNIILPTLLLWVIKGCAAFVACTWVAWVRS